MPKSKNKQPNQTLLIVIIALALATAGYFGYKQLLVTPDINQMTPGEGGKSCKWVTERSYDNGVRVTERVWVCK